MIDFKTTVEIYSIVEKCIEDAMASSEQASLVDHGHDHDDDDDMVANVAGENEGEPEVIQIDVENGENEVVAIGSVEKKVVKVTENPPPEKVVDLGSVEKKEKPEVVDEEETVVKNPLAEKKSETLASLLKKHRIQLLHAGKRGPRAVPPPKYEKLRKRNCPSLGDGPQMKMKKDRSSFKVFLPRVPADIGEKDIDELFKAEFGAVYTVLGQKGHREELCFRRV